MRAYTFFLLFLGLLYVGAEERSHTYENREEVVLWVNKVGPFRNPQETYLYYDLPFCQPQQIVESPREGLGEALLGYELRKSSLSFYFKVDMDPSPICSKTLSFEEAQKFKHAVKNHYWYQFYMDDLPIWGMVGENVGTHEEKQFIFTHMKFNIAFNGDRIIEVNLTSHENRMPIETGSKLDFTYSVNWHPTTVLFEDRFDKYLDYSFFEHQIHWFSILNSTMMVIFLVGLVSMILMRTLRKDYARYSKDDDDMEDRDVGDDSGWKQVHGDVFRPPPSIILFSSLVGTGYQLAILVLSVIFLSILGTYYRGRGTVVTAFILCYSFTSFVAGYGSGSFYAQNGGKQWIKVMVVTAGLFPGVCFTIAFFLNFIAIAYNSLATIPIGTMVIILLIWAFVSFPLSLLGTVIGKNWGGSVENPCRVTPAPRTIPDKKWYLQPWVNACLGGILPFGSIFIEMYFIFTSFWHYKYYYVYGFMLLVYIILVIVSICVTIVSTYFLLNSEDYRWQWTSFLSSASTAVYVFLYAVYYFFQKTKMSGFFQTCFYFGYMIMFCFGLGLLCGAIGFLGTSHFVRRIYRNVKIE